MIFQLQIHEVNEVLADKNIAIDERESTINRKDNQLTLLTQEKEELARENQVHTITLALLGRRSDSESLLKKMLTPQLFILPDSQRNHSGPAQTLHGAPYDSCRTFVLAAR